MRRDVEIADAGAIGQRHRDRRLQAALPPAGFEDVRDGAGAEGIALERARRWRRRVPAGRSRRAARASARCGTRSDSPRAARRSSSVATAGTASRSRSRALDGFAWRVAAIEAGDMRLLLDRSGRCRSCGRGARSPRCRRSRARSSDWRAASAGGARACAGSSSYCGRSARTASCRT